MGDRVKGSGRDPECVAGQEHVTAQCSTDVYVQLSCTLQAVP